MPKQLIIDGKAIEVEDGITLIQACEQAGVEIPRFCYHERLSIAGNCRMCLIEVVGMPKPIASCAMGVNDLPPNKDGSPKVITTTSPMVKKAREGVMEFLLINHPLDCPICDQGGECDLQDQAMAYGVGGSRYAENKRAVEEKYLGPAHQDVHDPLHPVHALRALHDRGGGVEELGAIGRGEDMEITTYLERGMMSELSANVVDLCPVGALTHRPWAFTARPWELRKTESIDVMDAVGSAIRVDCARPRGGAHPAAQQRCRERGVDLRQDAPRRRRAAAPSASTGPTSARTAGWSRPAGTRRWRWSPPSSRPPSRSASPPSPATSPARRRCSRSRTCSTRLGSQELDCRQDGAKLDPQARARELSVQRHHRGHRAGRRDPAGRHQSAARSGGAQCAHPQALAAGRAGRRR